MNDYIGISEDRLHHIIGVAKQCYNISKILGMDEDFCRKMFVLGWNHDIGYEFSIQQTEHGNIGEQMLKQIIIDKSKESQKILHAIRKHTVSTSVKSMEWYILTYSDLTVDSKGNIVTINDRLNNIKEIYGSDSIQYNSVLEVVKSIEDFINKIEVKINDK